MTSLRLPNPPLRLVPADDGDADDVALLRRELSAARAEAALLRSHAHRLDAELHLAARLQQEFLPPALPRVGPVSFHALFRPAGHVSGDFYDVLRLDETRVGFYVADAVGHGVPAALLTMFVRHALTTKQCDDDGYRILEPADTLARLNESLLARNLSVATFASAVYGVVDTATRQVTIARAGHPPPLLLRASGEPATTVEPDGALLGVFPGECYGQQSFTLAAGDRLVVTTDGTEVAFTTPEVSPSDDRWHAFVAEHRHRPAGAFLTAAAAALDRANGGDPPRDDLTLLVVDVD